MYICSCNTEIEYCNNFLISEKSKISRTRRRKSTWFDILDAFAIDGEFGCSILTNT